MSGDNGSGSSDFMGDVSRFARAHKGALSVLSGLIIGAGVVTAFTLEWLRHRPLSERNAKLLAESEDLRTARAELQATNALLSSELEDLRARHASLEWRNHEPVLIQPCHDAELIGDQVTFTWEPASLDARGSALDRYETRVSRRSHMIELRKISDGSGHNGWFNLVPSSKSEISIHFAPEQAGSYIWRLQGGRLEGGSRLEQSPASGFCSFSIHPDVVERIEKTGVVRVGTSPSFAGSLSRVDSDGSLSGLEIDLIEWLIKKLDSLGKGKAQIRIIEGTFGDLAALVRDRSVDLIISSITRTTARSESWRGVAFSDCYLANRQVLYVPSEASEMSCRKPDIKALLKGRRVGVVSERFNAQAATFLSPRFDFQVEQFRGLAAVNDALGDGAIDFGMTDLALIAGSIGKHRHRLVDCDLTPHLKEFYARELPTASETYSIVMPSRSPAERELMASLNRLLRSDEGRQVIRRLAAEYFSDESVIDAMMCE